MDKPRNILFIMADQLRADYLSCYGHPTLQTPAMDWLASRGVRFDRAQMSLDAATQGLGVALESATIAGRHVAEKKLRPLFAADMAIKVKAQFAVYPVRHAKRAPVEAFLDWLHREASKS